MARLSLLTRITLLLSIFPLISSLNLPYYSGYISYSLPPHPHPQPPPSPSAQCPTIIHTSDSASCPQPTPTPCPAPDCIVLSSLTNPCDCPTSVATVNVYTPCPKSCDGACSTQYTIQQASTCPTDTSKTTSKTTSTKPTSVLPPTIVPFPPSHTPYPPPPPPITTTTSPVTTKTQPATCKTVTATEGPECWTAGCSITYSRCRREGEVTLSCGCESVKTVSACLRTCDGGCWTDYATKYLPCPATPTLG